MVLAAKLRALVRRSLRRLHPFEALLINSVADQLSPEPKALLERQVQQINLVQRHASGTETNLYCVKRGKVAYDEEIRFPNTRELKLATVLFQPVGRRTEFRADFWMVHGYLFSIEFNASTDQFANESVDIKRVEICSDPMLPEDATRFEPAAQAGWTF